MMPLSVVVLDQTPLLGNVHVKMSVLLIMPWCCRPDLFPLISDFAVLDFCELYSNVYCPIVLKLNLIKAQEADLGHLESDDDVCLEVADERNLQFITTTKTVWCKTREDEYLFALDDAVINGINIVLDEDFFRQRLCP